MDQNQSVPLSTTSAELLQAQAKLWCHAYRYVESMALKSAIDLGIPKAIHRNNGSASLPELLAALPLATNKKRFLSRLMRLLVTSGIFTQETSVHGTTSVYRLTATSRLLVDGIFVNLTSFVNGPTTPNPLDAFLRLGEWFQNDGDTTPFTMVNGSDFWDAISHDARVNMGFNAAMASDSHFVAEIAIREYAETFMSIRSLVDVGGGDGTMARTIVKAFPHIKCLVLDQPHVVHGIPNVDMVEYVAGDMMDFIPPADVVLLKIHIVRVP
ncbi:hypothetical protein E2562_023847 [Oryza meyeriana var. granulata]|uniref:O-methyltransferase domain-containing protein n=1 Tax=Oryza meyeriana var. granulata TaxID=110450 RepID=A0A6G1D5X0_9ORYZ|nr:hypothetical protein E2562_023847 [Oryza meyeriana var. granulata]